MSAVGCFGRFTFSHLAFHIPTLAGSCLCLFCVVVCLVALFLCFWFLFCKCLGIPNSPRSLDLDDRSRLDRSLGYAMQVAWTGHNLQKRIDDTPFTGKLTWLQSFAHQTFASDKRLRSAKPIGT